MFGGNKDQEEEDKAEEEVEDEEPQEKEKKSVCTMKRGDYMIHIYVEQAKNMDVEEGDTIDPIVEINCLNERKFTSAQDDLNNTSVAVWNEHLFFEPKNVEVERLEKGKIEIKLMDKGFFKDALVGYYEFDLSSIYGREDHALMHKWIVMTNPEGEEFGKVTSYLKLSITVCGAGDEQVQIEDDLNPQDEEYLQPPQVQPEFYQMYIRLYAAQKLPSLDGGMLREKKIDAYVRCDYKGQKLKTKVSKQPEGGECDWNQEFLIPLQVPLMGSRIVLKVFDEDTVMDEVVGAITLDAKDFVLDEIVNVADKKGNVIKQINYDDSVARASLGEEAYDTALNVKNGRFFWKNVYGAPLDKSGKAADMMNENPEMGSLWKGRILMQVFTIKTDKPVYKVQQIPEEEVEISRQYRVNRTYRFMTQINAAIALPEDDREYEVIVRIADKEITTGPAVFAKGSYNRFNFRTKPEDAEFTGPYINREDIGSVFVYLRRKFKIGGLKDICYYRCHVRDFFDPNPVGIKWIQLLVDKVHNEVKEPHKAGLVGMRLSVHDVTQYGPIDWSSYKETWGKRLPRRPGNLKVRAYIFQCRDLPAADSDGTSDPFLMVIDSDTPQRTEVVNDNLNPIYYEAIDLMYEANSLDDLPPFIIDCYDEDQTLVGKNDADFLARAAIQVGDAAYSEGDAVPEPKWHPMRYSPKGPMSGEVLISFSIVEDDYNFAKSIEYQHLHENVDMREFQVSMNVLGMRGLQSTGLLPVKKAFVNFNLKGLVPPKIGTNLKNLKTDAKAPGPNPTINTLMQFFVPLPIKPLYCPRLSCQVYDQVFAGFSQPIIGNFTIPIGELIHELAAERKEEIAALRAMVKTIDKIAKGEERASLLAKSMRSMIADQMAKDGASESAMTAVRMTPEAKAKIVSEFSQRKLTKQGDGAQPQIEEEVSVNADTGVDTQALLQGDADDEIQLKPRLIEKTEHAVEGKAKRVTYDDLRDSQKIPREDAQDELLELPGRSGSGASGTSAVSGRRQSKLNLQSPSHQKFDPKMKKTMLAKEQERQEKAKRDAIDERQREMAEFKSTGNSTSANVILPKYKRDEVLDCDRETEKPPETLYIALGWDEDATTERKHYRRFYPDELENVKEVLAIASPFQTYEIKRGQTRGASAGFWASLMNEVKEDESGQVSTEELMGKFKAVIEVEVKEEKEEYFQEKEQLFHKMQDTLQLLAYSRGIKDFELDLNKLETIEGREELEDQMEPLGIRHLRVTKILADIQSDVILQKLLLQQSQCIVRVYMISAYDLASRDIGGLSDPYIKISCGEQEFSERDNYALDEANPDFGQHYDFPVIFPGCPPVRVDIMDYDDLFGDDLIGTSWIDMEDRYFLAEWRALADKPVEYRQIYHPSSSVSQGVFKCWVEINQAKVAPEDEERLWDITKKPDEEFEVRLVVWDTKEIKMMDDEGTSDVYIRAFFDSKNALETDCHYRCQTGKASFNYRLLFREKFPRKDYRLNLQAYDRDFFKSNDIIGSCMLDLKQAFEDVSITKRPLGVNQNYFTDYILKDGEKNFEWKEDGNSFFVPMVSKNGDGKMENNGFVRIQIEIVPADYAETNKVGDARDEPNQNPFLPPPVGRLSFSLNPCTMFKQLVGPAMRRKIYCYCCLFICIALCCTICIFVLPSVIGTVVAGFFTP